MSRRVNQKDKHVKILRSELEDLKKAALQNQNTSIDSGLSDKTPAERASAAAAYEALAPHEQAAASLGVSPESWRPISFMNNLHHTQLLAANALGPDLARRIEAYRVVAQTSAAK